MAEVENDSPSPVSVISDTSTSSSLPCDCGSGSGTSEVNRAAFVSQDQCGKNNSLPLLDVNDLKNSNGVSIHSLNEIEHLGRDEGCGEVIVDVKSGAGAEDADLETQENMKNEQLSQSQRHSSSSDRQNDSLNASTVGCTGESKTNDGNKPNKKKRGVRFRDESCINDCLEPPDPWKNAPVWTTDELITAYRKSCEIHGCKPLVRILQLLHTISTPGKRKESFCVKGEKLDQKQIECIEEIFRRVQFQLLDFEATHLDDECAVALFDMIEHYESACQLNVSFNRNIGARGWQACSRLVRRTPTLNFLDIRNCDLNERTIPIFGRALKMGCHLTVLHMEGMSLTTRPLIILVAALKMNDTLQELFLAENKLVPTDGVQLGNLMRYNHKLNLLDLRNNNLQDVGVSHLCDGLIEQKSGHGLRTLVLWNNQISYQAMHALGRALGSSSSLETLNIGHNGITNEGVHLLKDGLLKTTSLLRLGLQGTRISDEGGVALAEYIADSTILLRIDLRDNDIKTGGLMALSHAMRVNNSVTRIDLDKETKKESGMKEYAEVQIQLLRDILTFQERNVQLVMEKEEADRIRLEKLAIEAEAAREKERTEQESENSPLAGATNSESFTIIEAENVEISVQEAHHDNEKDKESSPSSENDIQIPSFLPSVTFSEEEEHMPTHQRPSVLFARMGLQPQQALDSPITLPNQSDVFQSPTETSARDPPRHPTLPLPMPGSSSLAASTPPGEILLSPQYYPKQLARKIFSVSRVSEDSSISPSASPSEDGLCGFDPLNVSLVNLIPISDSNAASASTADVCASEASQASADTSLNDPAVSTTTLLQDLENETVKHVTEQSDMSIAHTSSIVKTNDTSELEVSLFHNCDKNEKCDSSLNQPTRNLPSADEPISVAKGKMDVEVDCVESSLKVSHDSMLNKDADSGDASDVLTNCSVSEMLSSSGSELSPQTEKASNTSCGLDSEESDKNSSSLVENVQSDMDASDSDIFISQSFSKLCSGSWTSENTSSSSQAEDESSHLSHEKVVNDSNSCNNHSNNVPSPEMIPTNLSQEVSQCDKTHSYGGEKDSPNTDNHVVADGIDVGGVDLSLEEEPWTALETDDSSMQSSSTSGGEKQPDFFTTLSMNGLTQELASALTSLDGSSQEEVEDAQCPDEFERELDAMVAEVQSNSSSIQ